MPLSPLAPHLQKKLFDRSQFRADLTLSRSPIPAYKRWLEKADHQLQRWFRQRQPIEQLLAGRTWVVDQVLQLAWEHFVKQDNCPIALIAVGGYGRGELHLHSDIDLLILLERSEQERYREQLERFLTLLWDINLQVGHSVRSIEECLTAAASDLSIITNLLESRTLSGPDSLRQQLLSEIDQRNIWPSAEFLQAKYQEQRTRHRKFNNTEYNLEPNLKSSPGGLRDLQMLGWVCRRKFGADTGLADLVQIGFLTEDEYQRLRQERNRLWRIRWGLHQLAGRAEDRLLFDHQRTLAAQLGYEDKPEALAVEQFMQHYYLAVMNLGQLDELLLQHFDDNMLQAEQSVPCQPLNEHFQIRNRYLEPRDPQLFAREPSALLELFVLLTQNPELQGATAGTLRLIRTNLHRIDEDFRHNPVNQTLFLELLKAPYALTANLRRLVRHGILARYLPEFEHCIGQMQHDLFHQYTVDAHSLLVVKFLRRFSYASSVEQFPVAHQLMAQMEKPELCYLAALLHDIAKGLGGNHAERGANIARSFCQRHHMERRDTELVSWLVDNHLLMSSTAQRQDLSDPAVIHRFAEQACTEEQLDYLYCLTVADINATNPTLWNGWRASLLRQLHDSTRRALRRGLENPLDRSERIKEVQQQALEQLHDYGVDATQVRTLWQQLGEDYFLKHTGEEILWHSTAIVQHGDSSEPLILVRDAGGTRAEQGTQLFVYTPDRPHLFALCAQVFDQLRLSIHAARIITASNNYSLDTFMLLDANGQPLGADSGRIERICKRLAERIAQTTASPTRISRRTPRQLKHFSRPAHIVLSNPVPPPGQSRPPQTVIEVFATDRPGLLAHMGATFVELGLLVHNALISTLGERVEDVFFVTDMNLAPISDPDQCEQIRTTLCQRLDRFTGVKVK